MYLIRYILKNKLNENIFIMVGTDIQKMIINIMQ